MRQANSRLAVLGGPLVAMALLWLFGCATIGLTGSPPDGPPSLRLIGRFGMASACPVGPELAYTSAHVVDIRPFDRDSGLYPLRFDDGKGLTGTVFPAGYHNDVDLAKLVPDKPFRYWYRVAKAEPESGSTVTFSGYDWRKPDAMFSDRSWTGRVIRVRAGHVVLDSTPTRGASGSCVLNSNSEAIAVISWGVHSSSDDGRVGGAAGVAVGIWGSWGEKAEDPRKKVDP